MNTCYIACALDCDINISPKEGDLVIGADRGYFTLVKNGVSPHVAIGDFDSYTGEIDCKNVLVYPVKKDDTDSALAIKYACENGYKRIIVYGAIGGALDHTIANIALTAQYAEKGVEVAFVDGDNVLFGICNSRVSFDSQASGRISVFSYGDKAVGVYEKGLLYTLENATLDNKIPLGVSNEFIGEKAQISVSRGVLLVYTNKNNYKNHLTRM